MLKCPSRFRSRYIVPLVTFLFTFTLLVSTQAQTVDIIHKFDGALGEGTLPYSGLIEDAAGNFYGTTYDGGAHNFGTVYRLSLNSSGGFTESILYSFKGGSTDGAEPHSSLFRDSAGNLYGTTLTGGIVGSTCNAGNFASPIGCGIIFKLSPTTTGEWTETVLHRFSGPDGGNSFTGLVRDASGNFYGATIAGGSKGLGVIFKLSLAPALLQSSSIHRETSGARSPGAAWHSKLCPSLGGTRLPGDKLQTPVYQASELPLRIFDAHVLADRGSVSSITSTHLEASPHAAMEFD